MNNFWRFVIAMVIAVIAILLGVILGDYGPWYLSWMLGTGFMVLVAASGAVLFEGQEDALAQKAENPRSQDKTPRRELEY